MGCQSIYLQCICNIFVSSTAVYSENETRLNKLNPVTRVYYIHPLLGSSIKCTGLHRAVKECTGCTGLYWLYWAVLDCTGLYWSQEVQVVRVFQVVKVVRVLGIISPDDMIMHSGCI